jgi:DNA-binding transcriptional LysR family regulator
LVIKMNPRQLTYFVAAARREHLGTAAAELGISEPALSRSIGRLERELGVRLFDRVGRGLRLNGFGKLVLDRAERAFNELYLCEQQIRTLSAGAELVTIGFIPSLGESIVPKIFRGCLTLDPKVYLRFEEGRGPILRTMLLNGDVDLYVGTLLFPDPAIEWVPAWDEGVVAVLPAHHHLASQNELELDDLARERWLLARSAGTTRRALIERARAAGFAADVAFESDDFATIMGLVEAGYGVGLLPEHCAPGRETLAVIPIRSGPNRTIGIGHSRARQLTRAAAGVLEIIASEMV